MLVNCLLKYLAIAVGLVQVLEVPPLEVNDMGWLGGIFALLPERFRMVPQKLSTLEWWEMEEM